MSSLTALRPVSRPAARPPLETLLQRGAYAVIADDAGRILLVETPTGRHYLPGGRLEPDESPRQALLREIAEECGWSATIAGQLLRAEQPIMGGDILLAATYWRANLLAPLPVAPEHCLHWLSPPAAARRLHRAGDAAALRVVTG